MTYLCIASIIFVCFSIGDSGGPLFKVTSNGKGTETHTIVGVTSWGYGCADENFPGVYASTSGGWKWIQKTICGEWFINAKFCDYTMSPTETTTIPTTFPTSYTTTSFPSSAPTAGKKGKTGKAAKAKKCKAKKAIIEVSTDIFPGDSSWYLENDATGEKVSEESVFDLKYSTSVFEVELCSGESYTSILKDSFGDGQYGVCPALSPYVEVTYEDNVLFSLPAWYGDSVESDPFVVSNDPGDCDLVVVGTVNFDQFPQETSIKVVIHETGEVIFETKPGDFTELFGTYTTEVTVCPQVEYRIIVEDDYGDGQNIGDCDSEDTVAPFGKSLPGMIGTLDTGKVLFDALGSWVGDELQETFVVP